MRTRSYYHTKITRAEKKYLLVDHRLLVARTLLEFSGDMIGADALRKLLYREEEEGDLSRRGYHYACAYDGLLSTAVVERPAAAAPRSGYPFSTAALGATFVGCLMMKARNKEKWWFGLFCIMGGYYNAMKSHKAGNGLVGHQGSFWTSVAGLLGLGLRTMVGGGNRGVNLSFLLLFGGTAVYDLGRFHMWMEHLSEFRAVVTPQRSLDLLREYVPTNVETEFVNMLHLLKEPAPPSTT